MSHTSSIKYELPSRSTRLLWALCFLAVVADLQASVIHLPTGESATLYFHLTGPSQRSFPAAQVEIDFSRRSDDLTFTLPGKEDGPLDAVFGAGRTRSTATLALDAGILLEPLSIEVTNHSRTPINILDYKVTGFEAALKAPPLNERVKQREDTSSVAAPASALVNVPATLSLVGLGLVALLARRRGSRPR